MTDDPVLSARLELPLLEERHLAELAEGRSADLAAELRAVVSDEWIEEVRHLAARRLWQVREIPTDGPWLVRPMILRDTREVVGFLNFHGAPDERGVPEIGYTVLPAYRRRGFAREAVRTLFNWAAREHAVRRFRASVSPDNEPSLTLIRGLGFTQVGDQWDEEDGLELVFEMDWPLAEPADA